MKQISNGVKTPRELRNEFRKEKMVEVPYLRDEFEFWLAERGIDEENVKLYVDELVRMDFETIVSPDLYEELLKIFVNRQTDSLPPLLDEYERIAMLCEDESKKKNANRMAVWRTYREFLNEMMNDLYYR